MTQISHGDLANETIRNFLRAVVLIDDHWSEAQNAPILESLDPSQLDYSPPSIPPQKGVDETSESQGDLPLSIPMSPTDPSYLREIGTEITNEGFLFTGISYTDAKKEVALKLASKSDILILDWYLGTGNSGPALAILEELKNTGSPRFIFILTDQNLDGVREEVSKLLGEVTEGTDQVFSCGPFSFSLKNKPQAEGPYKVLAGQVLKEAIAGISARFGGLLQLASLELLGQYRDCLHEVLDQFHADTDFPFILEWLEQESPIRDSHSFNALAIDEWTARVTQRFPASRAQIIKDPSVSALLKDWKEKTTLPENHKEKLVESVKKEYPSFPSDQNKVTELLGSLDEWMSTANCKWPTSLKGQKNGNQWSKNAKRTLAMQYLGLRKGITSPIESLTKLDVLFQCQANLPSQLNQGTVLITPIDIYYVCITPTCDCSRPSRINNCYVFLEAKPVDIADLNNHPEGSVIAVRSKDKGNLLLAVALKPTYTYKIANPNLKPYLFATVTPGKEIFVLQPVAQLRPARVQSLISLAAGKAIEIGLDRSELLRQLCKSNKPT